MPDLSQSFYLISVMALPFLLAITLHEAGHAYAAHYLGDKTQENSGRLSFNPLSHLDPFGSVALPLIAVFTGFPFLIGYAKPVMIQPQRFKKMRRDLILVALAGPAGNLVVAIFCAYILRFAHSYGMDGNSWLMQTMLYGIFMNCLFMVFNLLPIPPLDGGGVVEQLLPYEAAQKYRSIAPYGFFILMAVIVFAKPIILVPTLFMSGLVATVVGAPW